MLFKNVSILDENFDVQHEMFVGTNGDTIGYISDMPPEPHRYGVEYDGKEKLLMPGFVNAHSHIPMSLLRGYGENLTLDRWLHDKIFPFEALMTDEDIFHATLLGIAEMLRFGITSTTDMYSSCDTMCKAFILTGAKVNISRPALCFDKSSFYDLPHYVECKHLFETYHGANHGKILVDMSIHAEYTSTEKVVREVSDFTKQLGTNMHIHLSETKEEHEACIEKRGKTPAAYFHSIGMFDNKTTAAHCVFLSGDDFELLHEKGVTVATCPTSNLKLASGIADVKTMMEKGIAVAIGTDGMASNNNANFLEDIKLFALLHKGKNYDPTLITPKQAIQAATLTGAESQGRTNTGLIKEGYQADIILLDTDRPYLKPSYSELTNLVYSGVGTDVCLTMVDGKILYDNGKFTTIDVQKAVYETDRSKARILEALSHIS